MMARKDPRIERINAAQPRWQEGQPRRCETNQVGAAGECLACDAEQGVHCLKPPALSTKPPLPTSEASQP